MNETPFWGVSWCSGLLCCCARRPRGFDSQTSSIPAFSCPLLIFICSVCRIKPFCHREHPPLAARFFTRILKPFGRAWVAIMNGKDVVGVQGQEAKIGSVSCGEKSSMRAQMIVVTGEPGEISLSAVHAHSIFLSLHDACLAASVSAIILCG